MMAQREKSYDELLSEIPAAAREVVAAARNHRITMQEYRQKWEEESAYVKASIRQLHYKLGINPTRISALMQMSRNRVMHIIEDKPDKGAKGGN